MDYRLARKILGTPCTATYTDIKRAYREKLKEIHPDRNPRDRFATEKLATLVLAYAFLKSYRSPFQSFRYSRRFKCGGKKSVALARLVVLLFAAQLHAETIHLHWNANSEIFEPECDDQNKENDRSGYRIHWSNQSGILSNTFDVGDVTTAEVANLEPGVYYFAISALDACGNESAQSQEISKEVLGEIHTGETIIGTSGNGSGNVTVQLQATPAPGSRFVGWSGSEDCLDGFLTALGSNCRAEFELIEVPPVTISSISRSAYKVAPLAEGAKLHIDTEYALTSFPAELIGSKLIQTANAHKAYSAGWNFMISRQAEVYVLWDSRATMLPDWLKDFRKAGQAQTTNVSMDLLKKTFPAGTVSMGNNIGAHTFSMYSVAVK